MKTIRHAFFIVLGIAAVLLAWPYAFQWMAKGGNIFDVNAFFGDAIGAGGTAAFLTIDLLVMWIVFMVWVVFDAKRIGAGYKWGFGFLALSFVGVSMAFPFYLVFRERWLDRHGVNPEGLKV